MTALDLVVEIACEWCAVSPATCPTVRAEWCACGGEPLRAHGLREAPRVVAEHNATPDHRAWSEREAER